MVIERLSKQDIDRIKDSFEQAIRSIAEVYFIQQDRAGQVVDQSKVKKLLDEAASVQTEIALGEVYLEWARKNKPPEIST